ncbi:MAG: trypsin-like peptidase domain-containing protein [Alicyclobacillus sp.]|nr:trypsin-like peptidase domain-containing protein [Alicyclobacillus sp.]
MGYYQSRQPRIREGNTRAWRWIGAMVLSALVGSGVTLAAAPVVLRGELAQLANNTLPAGDGNGSPIPTSTVNVNVRDGITQLVKKVAPDVVAVVNYTTTSDFFTQQAQTQESDVGSGVYFYHDGSNAYIVTNNHVVQGGTKVEIVLQSGKHVAAKVVGTDPFTDLAVLRVPLSNFASVQPIEFADSNHIQVGEPAIAIGNPMGLDFADSVTSGIVSGDQRMMPVEEPSSQQTLDYQPVIQTDAAINPGNSGGPLLNIEGQMIGINSSKIVATGFDGMGFAIPSNEVRAIASQLMTKGYAIHPSLGIMAVDLSNIMPGYGPNVPVDYGVLVQSVQSATAKAGGLQRGDVIVALNGKTIQDSADLRTALFNLKPGQTVTVTVYRGSRKLNLSVKIGEEKSPNTTGQAYANNNGGDSGGFGPFSNDPFSNFFGNPFGG